MKEDNHNHKNMEGKHKEMHIKRLKRGGPGGAGGAANHFTLKK